jgi:hypothetical protein
MGRRPPLILTAQGVTRKFYSDLRQWWEKIGRPHPLASFIAHTLKLNRVWPDVIVASNNDLPFDFYRHMASCHLESEQKNDLRE